MRAITTALIFTFAFGAWDLPAHSSLGGGGELGAWSAPLMAQSEASAWRKVSEAIPLGTKVKVHTVEGRRFSGALMRVDSNEILVKRNTRRPEPAIAVPYDTIAKLERDKDGGFNVGKAIAVGIASGAGAMITLILFAMHLD